MLLEQVVIGHASDVIANDAVAGLGFGLQGVLGREIAGSFQVMGEKPRQGGNGALAFLDNRGMIVKALG
jgi:hypothetical protein